MTRRTFLEGAVLGGTALTGLSWPALAAASQGELPLPPPRRPAVVKPVLIYSVPSRHPQTSWRNWGGIQTEEDARNEQARIGSELGQIGSRADFPFLAPYAPPDCYLGAAFVVAETSRSFQFSIGVPFVVVSNRLAM